MTVYRRTLAAIALAGAAVTVPCAAWYVVGSREAERQAERLAEEPVRAALRAAQQAAVRLGVRLEALRELEASRPYFHYQHRYHDPEAGCACAAFKVSPLAEGSREPLIRAHFQIDAERRLTLPTLEDDPAGQEEGEWSRAQRRLQADLEASVPVLAAAMTSRPERSEAPLFRHVSREVAAPRADHADAEHETQLLSLGPFRWRTLVLAGEPTLVGVREVTTTAGELIQGYLISGAVLAESLSTEVFPMRLRAGSAERPDEAVLPIPGAAWSVRADAGAAWSEALERAAGVRARFLRLFSGGAAAALLAGLCVVGLVWQTERLAQERARFAAAAAHELRTPLASLRLHGEMLAEGLGRPGRTVEYARRVSDEAERLGRVVTNVLGYTRLEQGNVNLHRERGDLGSVVSRCAEQLRPAVEAAGGRLEMSIGEALPEVLFDADAVHQMVQNLVDNAEKYSRSSRDRTIRLELAAAEDGVALSVSDRGPGMPKNGIRRLFRPFVRGGAQDAPTGLGLGLPLVEALARAHGGRLSYQHGKPVGATFTIILPA